MLQVTDDFPGFDKVSSFIETFVREHGSRAVVDVGGGANPVLSGNFVRENGIDYTVLDISQRELDKAVGSHKRLCTDIAAPSEVFRTVLGEARHDLIFSHMVFEHLKDPMQAHRNVHAALKPGGYAVHMYPSAQNLPLFMNRILPNAITTQLVKVFQPGRDSEGHQTKFPAYYRLCGGPSPRMTRVFNELGFEVIEHTGYIGHIYYDRFPGLRDVEKALRKPLAKAGIPMISNSVVVLRKKA